MCSKGRSRDERLGLFRSFGREESHLSFCPDPPAKKKYSTLEAGVGAVCAGLEERTLRSLSKCELWRDNHLSSITDFIVPVDLTITHLCGNIFSLDRCTRWIGHAMSDVASTSVCRGRFPAISLTSFFHRPCQRAVRYVETRRGSPEREVAEA